MKALFFLLGSFVIGSLAFSQTQSYGTVTLNVKGNRTSKIAVDNRYYTISNTTISEEEAIVINNLENGQHALEIVRRNQYNRTISSKTTFTLREGYDLTININSTGGISSTEKRMINQEVGAVIPVSSVVYNKLYAATKRKASSVSRAAFLENEFLNTNKRFTSKQASGLIQLINSESLRFKMAKLSYTRITDKENFSLVTSLLNSTANRTELNDYIATLPDDEEGDEDEANFSTPITDEKFRIIFNEVNAEYAMSDKNYYLINFFSKDFNYYTSSQARQLIQLISTESERFSLAKTAYRGITDRENYNQVYQLLNNSSNRSELMAYMKSYDNANTGTAMSAVDFNKLYQSVYYQNSASARYTSMNTAFTSPGNYFTVAQAKQMIQLVNVESSRLLLAKTVYKVLVDRANYTQLNDLLSTASRNEFYTYVNNYNNSYGMGERTPMSDAAYNQLYKSISDSWSSSSRVNLTAVAFNSNSNYFTTYQVRNLLLLINSESDRLSLAKSSYDNVTDQNNFSQLYDLFNTTNNRNELANFVAGMQNGSGTVVKVAMTAAEFDSIYRNVQFTFGIGAKMSTLTGIFNTETNYFTVAQAKQLLQMVSAEENRLELAKSSYNNISDPANFAQVYDIFSTQVSKDELAAYVASNTYSSN